MKNKIFLLTKKGIYFVLFFFILITVLTKVSWLFRGNSLECREIIVGYRNIKKIDVAFIGASNWIDYFSPLEAFNEQGIVSYNYATLGGPFQLYKYYIKDARRKNPQLYVVDIRMLSSVREELLGDWDVREWTDSMPLLSKERIAGITSYLSAHETNNEIDTTSLYFDLIKYHSNIAALGQEQQWRYMFTQNIGDYKKGYMPLLGANPLPKPKYSDVRTELTEAQLSALNELLDYCDDIKANVVFVLGPYLTLNNVNGIYNAAGDIITSRGYNFINFNNYLDEMKIDCETDFYEQIHLNYIGSKKYTHYLTSYLKEHYSIPDRRGDDEYSQWHEDYKRLADEEIEWERLNKERVESYKEAKKIGEIIRNINDFDCWYSLIRNGNFTVIIKKNGAITDDTVSSKYMLFFDRYKIRNDESNYIEAWVEDECVSDLSSNNVLDIQIPKHDFGMGIYQCAGQAGKNSDLIIADTNYNKGDDVQVVVIDNNYLSVIDNVGLVLDGETGLISLNRHELENNALFAEGMIWKLRTD